MFNRLERPLRAIEDFNQAILLDSDVAEAYLGRGESHAALNQIPQALENYGEAIRQDPGAARAFYSRGNAYGSLGHAHRAIDDWENATQADNQLAPAFYRSAEAYRAAAHLRRALGSLNHALRLKPEDAAILASRGATYAQLGEFQSATADLDEAIWLDPKHAQTHNNRAYIALNLGQPNKQSIFCIPLSPWTLLRGRPTRTRASLTNGWGATTGGPYCAVDWRGVRCARGCQRDVRQRIRLPHRYRTSLGEGVCPDTGGAGNQAGTVKAGKIGSQLSRHPTRT